MTIPLATLLLKVVAGISASLFSKSDSTLLRNTDALLQ